MDNISFLYKNLLSNLNGLLNVKDLDSRVVSVNSESLKLLGLSEKDVVDKKYKELSFFSEKALPELIKQDEFITKNKKTLEYFGVGIFKSLKSTIVKTNKFPMLDHNNTVLGTISHSVVVKDQLLIKKVASLKNYDLKQYRNIENYYCNSECVLAILTEKEKEILFYLVRGKTANDIANILYRSVRTVEAHISNIKFKLDVNTKAQLIELLVERDFLSYIPERLLKNDIILL